MNIPLAAPRGFRILKPLELLNWRLIEIGASVPLESQPTCPACANTLAARAVLSGKSGPAIRVGVCAACGYAGYMDRPARAWISRYYAEVWSHGAEKDIETLRGKLPAENRITATLRRALEIVGSRERAVLEIGAGYGTMLRFVRESGFENIVGIESSRRRAAIAIDATGLPILAGDFESSAIQTELGRRAPFGLAYLFHVLEHTYHPAEIIAAIARLQAPGDLLVVGVPNLEGEPAMNVLLFLPHLHSFTRGSLGELLTRAGYEIVDQSFSDSANLNIIARKGGRDRATPLAAAIPDLDLKFGRELAWGALRSSGRQRYFWSKNDASVSGIKPYRWYWRIADYLHGRSNFRSLLIEPLGNPSPSDVLFSIEFANRLFLGIK